MGVQQPLADPAGDAWMGLTDLGYTGLEDGGIRTTDAGGELVVFRLVEWRT